MDSEPRRMKRVPVNETGIVTAWYEHSRSSVEGRGPRITVGCEMVVHIDDLEEAKEVIAQTCRDIPAWYANSRSQSRTTYSPPEDEEDEDINNTEGSRRPKLPIRNRGKN